MALLEPNLSPTARELRYFGWVGLPVFFGLIGIVALVAGCERGIVGAIWAVGLVLCVAGLLSPRALRAIYLGWMYLFHPIGWTISHLVMATTFYLVLTPLGLVLSLTGRDPLRRKRDEAAETYWVRYDRDENVRRYFRQF